MKKWKYIKYILKYIIYNITLKCQTRGKKSSKYIFFIFRICPIKKNPLKKIFQKNNPSSSGWRVGMMLSYIIKLYYIVIFLEKCNLWNSSYWLNFESFFFEKPPPPVTKTTPTGYKNHPHRLQKPPPPVTKLFKLQINKGF